MFNCRQRHIIGLGAAVGFLLAVAFALPAVHAGCSAGGRERQQESAVDRLQALQPEADRTRVLVLATFHLRQIAETFAPGMLDDLVSRLEKFRPDAVCIEALPGSRVQELALRRDAGPLYGEVLDGFAARHLGLGKRAVDLLQTTPEAASAQVRELLRAARASGSGHMSPGDRAGLALWMLAAYEPDSAALQWSLLSAAEKKAQTAVPPGLAADLEREATRVNEVPALAARLARRLGLEKLDPVDDFEDLDAYAEFMPQLEKDFEGNPLLAAASKSPIYSESSARLEACVREGDLLPQYVFLNSPEYAKADVESQWGVFLRTRFASGTDRSRLGLWENRNLKIAARIRAVAALHPGGRVLVIYGAAHKPFLEAYLARAADIQLVRLEETAGR
jgi:hypothetical protein